MRNLKFLAISIACVMMLWSCEEKETEDLGLALSEELSTNVAADNLTPEQQKEVLSSTGVSVAQELSTLTDQTAINAAASMIKRMDSNLKSATPYMSIISSVASLSDDKNNAYALLKSIEKEVSSEEEVSTPDTIINQWNEIKGMTYTYNFSTKELEETENREDAIIINFPASETATTNTGKLKISNITTFTITEKGKISEEFYDLPKSAEILLTVNSKEEMKFVFTATYKADGTPTKVNASLTIGVYSLSGEFDNTNTKISTDVIFKNATKNIISFGELAEGTFTEDAMSSMEDESELDKVVTKAGAYIAIMDVKLIGNIDVKTMMPAGRAIDDKYESQYDALSSKYETKWKDFYKKYGGYNVDWTNYQKEYMEIQKAENMEYYDIDKKMNEEMIGVVNTNIEIALINTAKQKKICDGEFYVVNDAAEYHSDMNIKLKFGDGTYEDIETYFEKGFDNVADEFEKMATKMQNKIE